MAIQTIPRRSFLHGLGGVAVGLPALEIMAPTQANAPGAEIPCRYVVAYGGTSVGTGDAASPTGSGDMLVPETEGPSYEVTHSLRPLMDFDVRDEVSVVTNLTVPWGDGNSSPPGGWPGGSGFHGQTQAPQLTGARYSPQYEAFGESSDVVVARALAEDTPHEVLRYLVQPSSYGDGNGTILTWRDAGGTFEEVAPIVSPRLAYESLFAGFVPPDSDPEAYAAAQRLLLRRRSVVDLVKGSADRLMTRLGSADRQRMQQHLDELRALETRLEGLDAPTDGACGQLAPPGEDPPIGGPIVVEEGYVTTAGYSNEDLRAQVMADLIHMAFTCDLSRVATFQMTYWFSYMNMFPIAGWESDMHELSHGAGPLESVSDSVAWHVKHFARLTGKLRDTVEVDGSSLLDHTALVLLFEGGHGYDPDTQTSDSPHSTVNMSALIAGRAGGLKPGQHVRTAELHPANVLISAMHAVGVQQDLGEVTGRIDALFA